MDKSTAAAHRGSDAESFRPGAPPPTLIESARVNQQDQHPAGSAFKAHGDRREYNVYIETATVEDAWCRIPDWPLSSQVVPLLVSLEIAVKILDDCLRETGTRQYVNDASKAETVAACVGSLLTLIAEIAFEYRSDPPTALFGPPARCSAWTRAMAGLNRIGNGTRLQAELRCRYDLAVRMLGFDLGLMGTPGLDYDKWVRPDRAHRLYAPDRRQRYVEDPIFVRVHQVCEGILEAMLVELERVEAGLFKADYPKAEEHVLMAARFTKPFERAITVLSEMSQLDYAPLRVALRDASGIQSARAQGRKDIVTDQFWLFQSQLKHRGIDCFIVFANHEEYVPEYRLLQAFKMLAKNINESMSLHAHLVQNTLGSTVIGTAGFRIMSLGEVAALPLLPDLTRALDWLTLWTNLRFADHSGIVIREQETSHGAAHKYEYALPADPCDHALMVETAGKYFGAIRERDKEEWKRLFSESPHFEDPKGTKPYVSEWNLDVFFRNFEKLFPKVKEVEHKVVEYGSNYLTVEWRISAESFLNRMDACFGGTETFYFNRGGRILVAVAEWQPSALAQDLMRRYCAALSKTA